MKKFIFILPLSQTTGHILLLGTSQIKSPISFLDKITVPSLAILNEFCFRPFIRLKYKGIWCFFLRTQKSYRDSYFETQGVLGLLKDNFHKDGIIFLKICGVYKVVYYEECWSFLKWIRYDSFFLLVLWTACYMFEGIMDFK